MRTQVIDGLAYRPSRCPGWAFTRGKGSGGAWRSQYVYHFCRRSQTLGGHISVTIGLQTKNSSDLERAAAGPPDRLPQSLLFVTQWLPRYSRLKSETCGKSDS